MMRRTLRNFRAIWAISIALLFFAGCASLQVDVDVYKGPLAHEPQIQVLQYASMAISAKPLLADLYCKAIKKDPKANACTPAELMTICTGIDNFKAKFLCETLKLYEDSESPEPWRAGLKTLTSDVSNTMATSNKSPEGEKNVSDKVELLNQSLIFFAQKVLYVTNNELMFGNQSPQPDDDSTASSDQADPMTSVLQSLGNTILVHANDLQRQTTHKALQLERAGSEIDAVQQAFQPEPSVTMAAIINRLKHYSVSTPPQAADEPVTAATEEQKTELEHLRAETSTYAKGLAPLLAAYRTLVGELPSPLTDEGASNVDRLAAQDDRLQIAALYPDQPVVAETMKTGALTPLQTWLDREMATGVPVSPNRAPRLLNLKNYLDTEKIRLSAAGISGVAQQQDALRILQRHITTDITLARAHTREISTSIATLQTTINQQSKEQAQQLLKLAKAKNLEAIRRQTVAVVEAVRASVLLSADKTNTRDPKAILALLKRQLAEPIANASQLKLSDADIDLTRTVVGRLEAPTVPCSTQLEWRRCKAKSTIDVVDNLIASLHAQRIQAIATGDQVTAENLLKASNVAYDQRTQMIYLRPASDYLRSVYSSNQLQDGTEQQYRNMLFDWIKKYLNPFENDNKNKGRAELEKLHWQNVNKVTVTGGGTTNYVLAKDDVGNWYVKAYGSDPEAIIKSATSLALFNSGKSINVNLLRRFELQRKLDDDTKLTDGQRAELRKELTESNVQGGQSLLKVRDRYASRYQRDTSGQASALLATIDGLAANAKAEITKVPDWPQATCPAAETGKLLGPLEGKYLEPARTRLGKAVADQADPAKAGPALLEETEKSIQATLTAMHLYSSDAQRLLLPAPDSLCLKHQRDAADQVRRYVRAQVASAATERKLNVERYEEALSNIMEIAGGQ